MRRNRDERNRVDEITAFARKYDDRAISRREKPITFENVWVCIGKIK